MYIRSFLYQKVLQKSTRSDILNWLKGVAINSRAFQRLEKGEWRNNWDGAVLRSGESNEKDAIQFLNQTKNRFTA